MEDTALRQRIVEQLRSGRLALFVGADLPTAVTGLPSRADLARGLAHQHDLPEELSLAQVAQRVARGGFVHGVVAYLLRELEPAGRRPQRLHQLLARLPVSTFLSTAYDDMLALALEQAGRGLNDVVRGSKLRFLNPAYPTLLRLYGRVQDAETLVLTEDDHLSLWRKPEKQDLLDEVRRVLGRQAVLFLGYDLADPDFNLLWREVLDRAGRFAVGAYAAWPGRPEHEKRVWEDRHVRILEVEPLALVEVLAGVTAGDADVGVAHVPVPAEPVRPAAGDADGGANTRFAPTEPAPTPRAPAPPAEPPGKYNVDIGGATGVVIGDGAQVTQHFWGTPPVSPPSAPSPAGATDPAARELRREQLTDNIQQELALLKEYEDTLRLSSDPRERARCKREIEALRASLAGHEKEYAELG